MFQKQAVKENGPQNSPPLLLLLGNQVFPALNAELQHVHLLSDDCLGSNPALRDGVLIEFQSFSQYEAALTNPQQSTPRFESLL